MSKVVIIIPCYNEEYRLPLATFIDFIPKNNFHFCFVNDGSSDGTSLIFQQLKEKCSEKITIIDNQINQGKAEVIRQAVLELTKKEVFNYIGYFDADLSTPLSEIETLLSHLKSKEGYQFALGSRVLRLGVKIKRSATRHYLSRVFATVASKVLKLPVYDTQCGAKILKAELAERIFQDKFLSHWLFDVELFARVQTYSDIKSKNIFIEVPLNEWVEKGGSKIKLKDVFLFPIELLKIKLKYF